MIPQAVLAHTEEALELGRRSCLTCVHYKTRLRATWLVCELRPRTMEATSRFSYARAALARRRASKCKSWEGDDD